MSDDANPIKPVALDHVVVRARDIGPMIEFYRDVLGCTEVRMRPEIGLYHLGIGPSMIDLVDIQGTLNQKAPPDAERPNMDHLCIRIAEFDTEALAAHLARHGVAVSEVVTRFGAVGDGPSVYLTDPEGNQVELKAPGADD